MIIEDETMTLKSDLKECIAYKVKLNTNYHTLLFTKENMQLINSLGCLENLKIRPYNDVMRFEGEVAKDLSFSKEELKGISKNVLTRNMIKLYNQTNDDYIISDNCKNVEDDLIAKIFENDEESLTKSSRKPTDAEKNKLNYIKCRLEKLGLKLNLEETEDLLSLSGNYKILRFDKNALRTIVDLVIEIGIDLFLIAPIYDENEKCEGIRLVFGINLEK